MTYSELVNLIKESHDSWSVSEGMEHLPESEQEKDFLLEGIEPVEGFDAETLMGMLQDDFPEYDGNWLVYDMEDGTIEVEFQSQATTTGLYMEMLDREENNPKKVEWVNTQWERLKTNYPDYVARHQKVTVNWFWDEELADIVYIQESEQTAA
ncbi:MAG: hypothetical protein LBC94_05495 [Desulfovibrio sp.]|jgi:hypothetical protein|nr:hypothetical protein [Desulfovibrio sp.]